MDWTIRQIDGGEAACILQLFNQVQTINTTELQRHYRAEYDRDEVLRWLCDWLASEGTTALVAFAPRGAAVGNLIFGIEAREQSPLVHAYRCGMLHHIVVDRERRRIGVVSALLGEMKARPRAQALRA